MRPRSFLPPPLLPLEVLFPPRAAEPKALGLTRARLSASGAIGVPGWREGLRPRAIEAAMSWPACLPRVSVRAALPVSAARPAVRLKVRAARRS